MLVEGTRESSTSGLRKCPFVVAQVIQLHRRSCFDAVRCTSRAVSADELLTIEHKCLSNKHKLAGCCGALQSGRKIGTY